MGTNKSASGELPADCGRMTLVLYRRRAFTTKLEVRRGDVARVRYSRQKEAARGGGGRGLWKFNRFSPGNHWPKRDSAKMLLLMLIDVVVLAFIWIIVARGGLLFKATVQTTVSNVCISHALASAARAASLCAGHAQQLGGVSPSTQPDGGEGLAKRKGYRREAGSGRSVMQTGESMNKNRV